MRVIGYERQGAAQDVLELRDVPAPQLKADEVLVRVKASGINPHDTKARAGWSGAAAQGWCVPHSDGAGIVAQAPEGSAFEQGARVWFFGLLGGRGSAAEFVALPQSQLLALPENVSFEEGACLGIPAFTAWLNVLSDGPVQGQVMVVQGGGGAVGEITVELATLAGARVFATSRTAEGRARAAERGAEAVFAPEDPALLAAVMKASNGQGAARLVEVDFNANAQIDVQLLADHGVVASYSSSSGKFPVLDYYAFARKAARLRFVQGMKLTPAQISEGGALINTLMSKGHLRPRIAASFPLEETALAHDMVEKGAAGNVVVTL